MAEALKLRQMARILEGERNDWTQMLRHFLSTAMTRQTSRREYRTWTVEEGLLLLPSIPTGGSTTTKHLIKGWEKVRGFLKLDTKQLSLPGTLSMIQLPLLLNKYAGGCKYNERIVMPVLKRLGIVTLGDIQAQRGRWKLLIAEVITYRLPVTLEQAVEINRFQIWLAKVTAVWKDRNAFIFQNKRRRTPLILILHAGREELEGSCQITSSEERWNRGLRALHEINQLIANYARPPLPTQIRMKLETQGIAQRSSGQDPRPTEAAINARNHENEEDTSPAGSTPREGNAKVDGRSHVAATNVSLYPADKSLVTKEAEVHFTRTSTEMETPT
ncbi:hypothetical protein R1sor_004015 [Riccia sorocarpa]|uniref:Uncharacterized protein n=1 Tax=Riccia sorocarpa TaxID=122646 RepID=A0ABD3H3M4_9MARC